MATYIVTTNSDTGADATVTSDLAAETADGGGLSLREALILANSNADQTDITFDSVVFDADDTIVLSNGVLTISENTSLTGDLDGDGDADVTIDGDEATQLFRVTASALGSAAPDVVFDGLELTGGVATAGYSAADQTTAIYIAQAGTVTFKNGEVTRNEGFQAIYANQSDGLIIENSDLNRNVLAVKVRQTDLTVSDTAIRRNENYYGKSSAIYANNSTVDISNTTLGDNRQYTSGAMYLEESTTTLRNVTVAENTRTGYGSGSGIFVDGGSLVAENITVTSNKAGPAPAPGFGYGGAGLYAKGNAAVTLTNSIVLGNAGTSSTLDPDIIISNGSLNTTASILTGNPTDIFVDIDSTGGGELADNGGSIETVALKNDPTNPALDIGTSTLTEDATGRARDVDQPGVNNGGTVDAGATELGILEARSLVVTTALDVVDEFDGLTSLREAIAFAEDTAAGAAGDADLDGNSNDTITFASGVGEAFENGGTVLRTGGTFRIGSDITIDGDINDDGVADITIDSDGNNDRLFLTRAQSSTVNLDGLVITGTNADFSFGSVLFVNVFDTANITNSVITGNSSFAGGAISANVGATLTIDNSTISDNVGDTVAGAIRVAGGSATITNSTLSGNSTNGDGGAIWVSGTDAPNLTLINTTIADNSGVNGGGIHFAGGTLNMTQTTVTDNTASTAGGGVFVASGDADITNSIALGNSGASNPEIDFQGGTLTTTGSITSGEAGEVFATLTASGGGALADNGGDVQTVALREAAANPALDIGVLPAGLTTDAIGGTRSIDLIVGDEGTPVDAGAVELQVLSEITVFASDGSSLGGFTDFASALAAAQAGGIINVNDPAAIGDLGAVSLSTDDLTIVGDLPFDADFTLVGADSLTIFGSTPASVTGSSGDNDLLIGRGDGSVTTFGGMDTIKGSGGDDTISSGDNHDFVSGGGGDDVIDGGAGADTLQGNGGNDQIDGGAGADSIFGGAGNDTVNAGDDNDEVLGQGNNDLINGDGGLDTLRGGSGNDTLNGGADDDQLFGNGNNDVLSGDGGNDLLQGAAGLDSLSGGDGNDTITGGTGRDTLDGGTGNDTMEGGGQSDIFIFSDGYQMDRVNSFEQGLDTIALDASLWAGNGGIVTGQDVVDAYGALNGTGTILALDFGGGDVLELQNAGGLTLATLGSDIDII